MDINSRIAVQNWDTKEIISWLKGLKNEKDWFDEERLLIESVTGKSLLLISPFDLGQLCIKQVDSQEVILGAVEKIHQKLFNCPNETLLSLTLKLSCQSRALQQKLTSKRGLPLVDNSDKIELSSQMIDCNKQRVSLDSLTSVSEIIGVIDSIVERLNRRPFFDYGQYRSMRSLLIALGIELTSTAQRDQFVDRPNDIIERCAKSLADYCDRILQGKTDVLSIQPFSMECVRIRRKSKEEMWGISLNPTFDHHIIDKVVAISPAGSNNLLQEGDEIIRVNGQTTIGWTPNNVAKILSDSEDLSLIVLRRPRDTFY